MCVRGFYKRTGRWISISFVLRLFTYFIIAHLQNTKKALWFTLTFHWTYCPPFQEQNRCSSVIVPFFFWLTSITVDIFIGNKIYKHFYIRFVNENLQMKKRRSEREESHNWAKLQQKRMETSSGIPYKNVLTLSD